MNSEEIAKKLIIHTWPNEILTSVSRETNPNDQEIKLLAKAMLLKMKESDGIGLAAPQVGQSIRLFVINIPFTPDDYEDSPEPLEPEEPAWWHDKDFVFINPKIEKSGDVINSTEGCLSLPGISEEIKRHYEVRVSAYNLDGQPFELVAEDLFAICIQHENDHLDGKVFIEYLSRLKLQILKRKIIKERKKEITEDEEQT